MRRLVLTLDGGLLILSAIGAFFLHESLRQILPWLREAPNVGSYGTLLMVCLPAWLVVEKLLGVDRFFEKVSRATELLVETIRLHIWGFLVIASVLFLSQSILNRSIVFGIFAFNFALTYLIKLLILVRLRAQEERGDFQEQWVIMGTPGSRLLSFAERLSQSPAKLLGIIGPETGSGLHTLPASETKHLGPSSELQTLIKEGRIQRVVIFREHLSPEDIRHAVKQCEESGVAVSFVVDTHERFSVAPTVHFIADTACLSFEWVPERPTALAVKHAADALVAIIVLILASPVMLITAVIIRVTMGSPIFYVQERTGLQGRPFKMLKFRSMVHDADLKKAELQWMNEMSGPVFKVTADPRVTPFGRFIRKWSIDELPQLFNVVSGSMSLVGPRPLPVLEQREVEGWYRRRISMKPGITGLWQISGRSNVDFEEWMQMDLHYVDRWSLRMDLIILLRTLPAVIARRGAK